MWIDDPDGIAEWAIRHWNGPVPSKAELFEMVCLLSWPVAQVRMLPGPWAFDGRIGEHEARVGRSAGGPIVVQVDEDEVANIAASVLMDRWYPTDTWQMVRAKQTSRGAYRVSYEAAMEGTSYAMVHRQPAVARAAAARPVCLGRVLDALLFVMEGMT